MENDFYTEINVTVRKRRVSVKSSRLSRQSFKRTSVRGSKRIRSLPSRKRSAHKLYQTYVKNDAEEVGTRNESQCISSVISPSRKLSEAAGMISAFDETDPLSGRRFSEPCVNDKLSTNWEPKQTYLKSPLFRKPVGIKNLSTAAALVTRPGPKLEAIAKDELLANLNVVLPNEWMHAVSSHDDLNGINDVCVSSNTVDGERENIEKQKKVEKRAEKRFYILEEILKTEHNYVSCLEIVNKVFKFPLEKKSIVPLKHLKLMFPSSLDEILSLHTTFVEMLEKRLTGNDGKVVIGDIFLQMTSVSTKLLDIYTCYVENFPKSISTMTKYIRSSNKFGKFIEKCYKNPLVERLDLPSFLLAPVQRLPRYILLLTELLKCTENDHPDTASIRTTKIEIDTIIRSLDNSIKRSLESYTSSDATKGITRGMTWKNSKMSKRKSTKESKTPIKELSSGTELEDSTTYSPDSMSDAQPVGVVIRRKNRSRSEQRPASVSGDSTTQFVSQESKKNRRTSWRISLGSKISHLFQNSDDSSSSSD